MDTFFYIVLIIITFFPIVIWAYSFAFISNNPLNKKRFLFGILGGILSVFPILYLDNIVNFFSSFRYFNVFLIVSEVKGFFSSLEFSISLSIFLFFIVLFSFVFGTLLFRNKKSFKIYLRNFFVFLCFIFVLGIVVFLLNYLFQKLDFKLEDSISFGNIVFDTFRLIVFYYIIIAFIEEASKHFNFLQSSALQITSIKSGVESAIFVALGFSFVENILYLYNYFYEYSLSFSLIKLYFFRSVFSVIVHVLCSSVVAYYFSKALLLYREKDLSFPYLKIFSFGLSISILLHIFFDVALSLGFTFVLFIYFIGGYLYVSSIFYKDN